ncbi:MAG: lysophospholipid acyltransferase family protein [Oligoflexales bacterium]|nr:lysophospholipid acyltransferase family protein [Oligoflexales bacterium]
MIGGRNSRKFWEIVASFSILLLVLPSTAPTGPRCNTKTDFPMRLKLECLLFYLIARILYASYRFRYFGLEHYFAAKKMHPKGAFCIGIWHEHALASVVGQKGIPYCFLISQSKDGDYVDFLSRRFGYQTARGSSSRGGKEARKMIEEKVSQGIPAAFTVDGPRGPRKRCKLGVLITARNTQSVVLPVAAVAHNPWTFTKSWDQTKIPKFFSKIAYQFGAPIPIPAHLSDEECTKFLEKIDHGINETERAAYDNLKHWKTAPNFSALKKARL